MFMKQKYWSNIFCCCFFGLFGNIQQWRFFSVAISLSSRGNSGRKSFIPKFWVLDMSESVRFNSRSRFPMDHKKTICFTCKSELGFWFLLRYGWNRKTLLAKSKHIFKYIHYNIQTVDQFFFLTYIYQYFIQLFLY